VEIDRKADYQLAGAEAPLPQGDSNTRGISISPWNLSPLH
jgi:hypothetical protein